MKKRLLILLFSCFSLEFLNAQCLVVPFGPDIGNISMLSTNGDKLLVHVKNPALNQYWYPTIYQYVFNTNGDYVCDQTLGNYVYTGSNPGGAFEGLGWWYTHESHGAPYGYAHFEIFSFDCTYLIPFNTGVFDESPAIIYLGDSLFIRVAQYNTLISVPDFNTSVPTFDPPLNVNAPLLSYDTSEALLYVIKMPEQDMLHVRSYDLNGVLHLDTTFAANGLNTQLKKGKRLPDGSWLLGMNDETWYNILPGDVQAHPIPLHPAFTRAPNGDFLTSYFEDGNSKLMLERYSPTGQLLFRKFTIVPSETHIDESQLMTLSSDGVLIIGGVISKVGISMMPYSTGTIFIGRPTLIFSDADGFGMTSHTSDPEPELLRVFPNPVFSGQMLTLPEAMFSHDAVAHVYDASGQLLWQGMLNGSVLPFTEWSVGLHWVKVFDKNAVYSIKVIGN